MITDDYGDTPLDIALFHGRNEVLALLPSREQGRYGKRRASVSSFSDTQRELLHTHLPFSEVAPPLRFLKRHPSLDKFPAYRKSLPSHINYYVGIKHRIGAVQKNPYQRLGMDGYKFEYESESDLSDSSDPLCANPFVYKRILRSPFIQNMGDIIP